MGTKIDCERYMPVYYSMRDLNEDSSSSSWPVFCGDKTIPNGQYYNGFVPRTTTDDHPGNEKDALRQRIIEHETVFKNQVYELHRLYGVQRGMMEEVGRKELPHKLRESMEPSSSSSIRESQAPPQDVRKWHMAGFPLPNSDYGSRVHTPVVEIIDSPVSCTKESSRRPILRDTEALDSRPVKVRKKSFDLHLPAYEYIDTEEEREHFLEVKTSGMSSYSPNGNLNNRTESSRKLSLGSRAGLETDYRRDPSASASSSRNPTGLADLNEPIGIEEATAPSTVGFLHHGSINGETKGANQPNKSNASHLGINNGETVHFRNGFSINSVSETGHLPRMYEAGPSSKINFNSSSHVLEQFKSPVPSHLVQAAPKRNDHASGIYPINYNGEVLWREGRRPHGLESSYGRHDYANNGHVEPLMVSQSSFPFSGSSCPNGSWVHTVSSWANGKSSLTPRVPALGSSSHSAAAANRILQNSPHSQGPFGGNWRTGAYSKLNPGLGGEVTTENGFYRGSASGPKELKVQLPSSGFDCLNYSKTNAGVPDYSINHGLRNFSKGSGSSHVESKPTIDIDLNKMFSRGLSDEAGIPQDQTLIDGQIRPENRVSSLPWLSSKSVHGSEAAHTRKPGFLGDLNKIHASSNCDRETVRDLNQPLSPKTLSDSSDRENEKKNGSLEAPTVKKLLGFPIFATGTSVKEKPSHVSTSTNIAEGNSSMKKRKNILIDINLECDPDDEACEDELIVEKENQTKGECVRECFDLNSCATEGEDDSAPSYDCKTDTGKVALEIDLEIPISLDDDDTQSNEDTVDKTYVEPLESENNGDDNSQDETYRKAAEAIVSISMFCPETDIEDKSLCKPELEVSLENSLLWFVNALSSSPNELESESGKNTMLPGDPQKDLDEFEAMTLQLQETKQEDYMSDTFVPEVQTTEETGAVPLATRSRRGQSRRGRHRRDFQRDILPGLVSLSRPEVTEDLQIFGSLMRATGHQWASGPTRRNGTRTGGGRCRRRIAVEPPSVPAAAPVCTPLVQQLNNIETGLEDRSLTGWGKTTRRVRRQRCPSGNPPTIVLT